MRTTHERKLIKSPDSVLRFLVLVVNLTDDYDFKLTVHTLIASMLLTDSNAVLQQAVTAVPTTHHDNTARSR